ncbi:MAG: hypothetical protein LBG72_00520 [Spirochaetaceae bacterium]|jgi:hypothetical protein|nr:hypothetical protein [Spirochaetaceae bacterium]
MWRKIQALAGLVCLTLYACVLVWTFWGIFKIRNTQSGLAGREFIELRDFAVSASVLGFMGENYKKDLESALTFSKTIQALIITDTDGRTLALEKTKNAIIWDGDTPRFNKNPLLLGEPLFAPLRIEGMPDASLLAIASAQDRDALISVLRAALFAVLLTSGIAFAVLMLGFIPALNNEEEAPVKEKPAGKPPRRKTKAAKQQTYTDEEIDKLLFDEDEWLAETEPVIPEPEPKAKLKPVVPEPELEPVDLEPEPEEEFEPIDLEPEPETELEPEPETVDLEPETETDLEPEPETELEPADLEPEPETVDLEPETETELEPADLEPESETELEPVDLESEPEAEHEPVEPEAESPPPVDEAAEQRGLLAAAERVYERDVFEQDMESPEFNDAFESILENAMADGEDVCLAACEWINEGNDGLLDEAKDFFGESAAVFERKAGGIYIIMSDCSLNEGFEQAKEFSAKAQAASGGAVLATGISARGGRQVDTERLLKEARKALEKGGEDEKLPVVAFKVDLEKYNRLYAKSKTE